MSPAAPHYRCLQPPLPLFTAFAPSSGCVIPRTSRLRNSTAARASNAGPFMDSERLHLPPASSQWAALSVPWLSARPVRWGPKFAIAAVVTYMPARAQRRNPGVRAHCKCACTLVLCRAADGAPGVYPGSSEGKAPPGGLTCTCADSEACDLGDARKVGGARVRSTTTHCAAAPRHVR
jgi:hypothetical protein